MHKLAPKKVRLYSLAFVALVLAIVGFFGLPQASAAPADSDASQSQGNTSNYQIFPRPHQVSYAQGEQTLRSRSQAIISSNIDADTRARLDEVAALKGISLIKADSPSDTGYQNQIFMGIAGSGDEADTLAKQLKSDGRLSYEDSLFTKTDAYLLASLPSSKKGEADRILVLGKNSDAVFYGLTTLYQIFQQLPAAKLAAFTIADYADVVTRGFIEGYYGEPWSVQDRINLMKWGGYYKLNAYVYAPKDDSKHNAHWWELYTADELSSKIEPLAEAGNNSKCRFVFALHPFMHNPITSGNYDAQVAKLKAKFKQTIDHGVRQICILADDAANQGSALYTKLLKDMTAWLKGLQAEQNDSGEAKYEGLKDTIVFCPPNYMSWGESWYSNLPRSVQVINTGGMVWGSVNNNFTSAFTRTSGVGPFLWINWPCTDNTKYGLIMAGYDDFLAKDVQPGNMEGLVLNPMQQSEPSKAAIFMAADFTWHLWDRNTNTADIWNKSFSYVDHNSPLATRGSDGLRELSRHMTNSLRKPGDQGESRELKSLLNSVAAKFQSDSVTDADYTKLVNEFSKLQKAAKDYRANHGNADMFGQVTPWIDTWDDISAAALSYCEAGKAVLAGRTSELASKYAEAQASFAHSKGHGFRYINHTEYARVGSVYLTPFIEKLDAYLAGKLNEAVDPKLAGRPVPATKGAQIAFTDQLEFSYANQNNPLTNLIDGNEGTWIWADHKHATSPNGNIKTGDGVVITFDGTKSIGYLKFVQDSDTLPGARFEYQDESNNWHTIGTLRDTLSQELRFDKVKARAVRITSIANSAKWWKPKEITILENAPAKDTTSESPTPQTTTVSLSSTLETVRENQNHPLSYIVDKNDGTWIWLAHSGRGNIQSGDTITETYTKPYYIGRIHLSQASDKLSSGVIEYQDKQGEWHQLAKVNGEQNQDFEFANVLAKAIRLRSTQGTRFWWKINEFRGEVNPNRPTAFVKSNIAGAQFDADSSLGSVCLHDADANFVPDSYVALDLGTVRNNIKVAGLDDIQRQHLKVKVSNNLLEWTDYDPAAPNTQGRYVGLFSDGTQPSTAAHLHGFCVTYLVKTSPKLVSSTINNTSGAFNAALIFDGKLNTQATNSGVVRANDKIIFDLGQERDIRSIAYYVAETQLDFIRNAIFEVADSPSASQWTPVLQVGGAPVSNTYNENTAKQANWLTHDSNNPGYMYTSNPKKGSNESNHNDQNGTDPLSARGRYLRVRFTAPYSHRWVAFSEIVINGGEYVSDYGDALFESQAVETPYMSPAGLNDHDLTTAWQPSKESGSLVYNVDEPFYKESMPYQGVRIISKGAPSGATVTATLYNDDSYTSTHDVVLGQLDQSVSEFRFASAAPVGTAVRSALSSLLLLKSTEPSTHAPLAPSAPRTDANPVVKKITVTWNNTKPSISEFFLMPVAERAQTADLEAAITKAESKDSSTWTADAKENLAEAIAAAKAAQKNRETLTQDYADALTRALEKASVDSPRYSTDSNSDGVTDLEDQVAAAKNNDSGSYTAKSFQAYQNALNDAKEALKDKENLSQSDGDSLSRALAKAEQNLSFDESAYQRAVQALEDAKRFDGGRYTTDSAKAFEDAKAQLSERTSKEDKDPSHYAGLVEALEAAEAQLVPINELIDAQNQAKTALAHEGAYTEESVKALQDELSASEAIAKSGTNETVAQETEKLNAAIQALVPVSLDEMIPWAEDVLAQHKKADAGETNKEYQHFTQDTAATLQAALDAAKAEHEADQNRALLQALTDAREALVSYAALDAPLAQAAAVNRDLYTEDSLAKLDEAVKTAQDLYKSGSKEAISQATSNLENAIAHLATKPKPEPAPAPTEPASPESKPNTASAESGTSENSSKPGSKDPASPESAPKANKPVKLAPKQTMNVASIPSTHDATITFAALLSAGALMILISVLIKSRKKA